MGRHVSECMAHKPITSAAYPKLMEISHHQFASEKRVTSSSEGLSKEISNLILRRDMKDLNRAIINKIADIVNMYLNVFSTIMKDKNSSNPNCTRIIPYEALSVDKPYVESWAKFVRKNIILVGSN
ncbi:unnamed protein product [Linum trigynum]|uniref:Uncharacterized protein n=1 Tax=Linum trigynum TaxID=586398 RepID=A0AAV2DWP0_9ROSI